MLTRSCTCPGGQTLELGARSSSAIRSAWPGSYSDSWPASRRPQRRGGGDKGSLWGERSKHSVHLALATTHLITHCAVLRVEKRGGGALRVLAVHLLAPCRRLRDPVRLRDVRRDAAVVVDLARDDTNAKGLRSATLLRLRAAAGRRGALGAGGLLGALVVVAGRRAARVAEHRRGGALVRHAMREG